VGEGVPANSAVETAATRSHFMPIITLGKTGCGVAATLTLALIQFSATPALAAEYDIGSIHISQPWARATPKGASSGAAYLTITNNGTTPDRLNFCVASDTSRQCQIHRMSMENDVMKMRPMKDGLEIKPGETVTFKPGGFHMMFVDLKHPLETGLIETATLQFEKAGTLKVEFPVLAMGAAAPGTPAGGMMEGHSGMMQMDKH
jgi:periplasmic copper chaperone A